MIYLILFPYIIYNNTVENRITNNKRYAGHIHCSTFILKARIPVPFPHNTHLKVGHKPVTVHWFPGVQQDLALLRKTCEKH